MLPCRLFSGTVLRTQTGYNTRWFLSDKRHRCHYYNHKTGRIIKPLTYDSNYHNFITDYKMYDDVLQYWDEMAFMEARHTTNITKPKKKKKS